MAAGGGPAAVGVSALQNQSAEGAYSPPSRMGKGRSPGIAVENPSDTCTSHPSCRPHTPMRPAVPMPKTSNTGPGPGHGLAVPTPWTPPPFLRCRHPRIGRQRPTSGPRASTASPTASPPISLGFFHKSLPAKLVILSIGPTAWVGKGSPWR